MTILDRTVIILLLIWIGYNAQEVHRHSHEYACALNVQSACKYVKE